MFEVFGILAYVCCITGIHMVAGVLGTTSVEWYSSLVHAILVIPCTYVHCSISVASFSLEKGFQHLFF